MRSLINLTSKTILLFCLILFSNAWADPSQYDGKIFEGTGLNDHWVAFYSPPFIYKDNEIISVKATTSREALSSLVPRELTINEGNEIIFFVGTFRVAAYPFSYKEAGIVIPVTYKKGTDEEKKGSFIPVLYLDHISPIIGGRETYGYNKSYAEIEITEDDLSARGIVKQYGATLIDISVSKDQPKVTEKLELNDGEFLLRHMMGP